MNIVFMGTPDFAVPCLEIVNKKHNIVGVFTQPDKPKGRKQILTPPPIKEKAVELGLTVYQPASLRDGSATELIKSLNPDLIIVVAYGKILPKEILDLPKYKCINVHASLLPRHRGASPIQWCIVCGDKITGVTTQLMGEGIDTGDILLSSSTKIGEDETSDTLHDRLSVMGAELLDKTINGILSGDIIPIKQNDAEANYAPIIKKEMAKIDFNRSAEEIVNMIRGYNPWPCAYFLLEGKRIKVYKAIATAQSGNIGEVLCSDNCLVIGCGEGSISILEAQAEGSKRMNIKDMLRGRPVAKGIELNVEV